MKNSGSEESRTTWVLLSVAAAVLLLALSVIGCDMPFTDDEGTQLADDTTATTLPDATTVSDGQSGATTTLAGGSDASLRVYFSRDEKMAAAGRETPPTLGTGAAAMEALLEGPTAEEQAAGMFTAIPKGTEFLGLDIQDGIATVDLSPEFASGGGSLSMFTRLAQVVFTLTQFPTVDAVLFKLGGEPVTELGGEGIIIDEPLSRADLEDMSPAILVESPTLGATVDSPMRVTGTANVFEATFRLNIVDSDGLIVADEIVTATSGSGTRGTFDVTVPFTLTESGLGTLIVFAESPKDGSQIDVVEIPLELTK